jgi:hypothetical protein
METNLMTIEYKNNVGYVTGTGKPFTGVLRRDKNHCYYYWHGYLHRLNGPAVTKKCLDTNRTTEEYWVFGNRVYHGLTDNSDLQSIHNNLPLALWKFYKKNVL